LAGETLLHTANPILAGAVGGGSSTLVGQGLEKITGESNLSWSEIATNTIGGTAGGAVGGSMFYGGSSNIVLRSMFAGASSGGVSTATSELLQKFTGINDRSYSQIANDTIDSTITGAFTGAAMGDIIKAAGKINIGNSKQSIANINKNNEMIISNGFDNFSIKHLVYSQKWLFWVKEIVIFQKLIVMDLVVFLKRALLVTITTKLL